MSHRLRRSRLARGQGGMAMLAVLMITLVFGLIVVALLSTTMSSLMIGSGRSEDTAVQRAADAAIETWIGQFKTSAVATGSCGDVEIPGSPTVKVVCKPTTAPAPSGPLGNTSVLLLGGYTYTLRDLTNAQELLNGWLRSTFGWLADWVGANGPGFLHYGPEPLIIDTGDIVVRQQGLVWHEKTVGSASTPLPGPAVRLLDGRYMQRPVSWPFGNLLGSPMCGQLDPAFDSWLGVPDNGFHIEARGGLRCGQDPDSTFSDPSWAPPATFTKTQIRAGMGLTGACDARKLPGTSVVALDPGAYNRYDTAVLNRWFGPGDCDNVTFWFRPGDYYFDAVGLVRGDLFSRSALVFDDATANVVFGSPAGWTPGVDDRAPPGTRTCVIGGAAPGVTITLSTRTTILHKAGFVSACSDWRDTDPTDTVPPAQRTLLYQAPAGASERWIGKPTVGSAGVAASAGFTNPANATGGAADPDTSEAPTAKSATCSNCGAPSITLRGFSDVGSPAPYGALQSAVLAIRGSATGTWGSFWDRTQVDVRSADGTKWCVARETGIGTDVDLTGTNALEVFQAEPRCGNVFTEAADYEGATVKITFTPTQVCFFWCDPYKVTLDYAWLDISTDHAQPAGTFETRVDPQNGSQLTLFGPTYLPHTQIAIRWMGADPAAQLDPIFTGGLIAQALLSGVDYGMTPNGKPGKVAGLNRVDNWTTSIRAEVDGRLRATAVVKIDNAANRPVTIKEWRVCNVPATATGCPLPN